MPPEQVNTQTPIQSGVTKIAPFWERKIGWISLAIIILLGAAIYFSNRNSDFSNYPNLGCVSDEKGLSFDRMSGLATFGSESFYSRWSVKGNELSLEQIDNTGGTVTVATSSVILTGVDSTTFRFFNGFRTYIKNKNDVYFLNTDGTPVRRLDGANLNKLCILEIPATPVGLVDNEYDFTSPYAKDDSHVWYQGEKLDVKDVASFELLPYRPDMVSPPDLLAVDREHVYFHGAIVKDEQGNPIPSAGLEFDNEAHRSTGIILRYKNSFLGHHMLYLASYGRVVWLPIDSLDTQSKNSVLSVSNDMRIISDGEKHVCVMNQIDDPNHGSIPYWIDITTPYNEAKQSGDINAYIDNAKKNDTLANVPASYTNIKPHSDYLNSYVDRYTCLERALEGNLVMTTSGLNVQDGQN